MKAICIGNENVDVDELVQDLRVEVWATEQQIAGLQQYLDSRQEIIEWLMAVEN